MTFTADTSQTRTLSQGPQAARSAKPTGAGAVTWYYEGRTDGLVGTGATGAERIMGYGTALILTAIIVHQIWLPLGAGLEWVIPALFIKMVLGHAVQEEPYAAPSQIARPQAVR